MPSATALSATSLGAASSRSTGSKPPAAGPGPVIAAKQKTVNQPSILAVFSLFLFKCFLLAATISQLALQRVPVSTPGKLQA